MHYVLFYEFTSDYLERRGPYRDEHLRLAWEAQEKGELVLAGAFSDPADGALLLFDCESRDVPLRFAAGDPYVLNGLVMRHYVRPWTTVIGEAAHTPIRPRS